MGFALLLVPLSVCRLRNRELVQLGYKVRAGVRDVDKAQFLVEVR